MTEVISLINEKGGVGKSTSAITIAQILAISEYKILLIDLDPQMNTTKMYGQAEANPDIDYKRLFCEKQNNKDEVMNYITKTEYNNISILTASRELNSLIYKIYDKMKDNSPFKSYLTSCAMCASDKVITPICVDNFSYDGLMSLFDTIEELNDKYALSIEFAGIFMTRVAGRTTLFRQMYESYENMFGDRFLPISIRNCIAVNESNTTFEPLLSYDKKCPASLDYVELVNYLGLMDTAHYRKLARYLKGEK